MQVVILAGGLATRLGSIAEHAPKSMINIEGHPFIAYQLSLLKRFGASKVLLCVGHLGDQVRSYVGDGSKFGLAVSYSDEGPHLLGTAGALKNAEHLLETEFALVYGDSYFVLPIADIWARFKESKALGMMVVLKNKDMYGPSNSAVESGLVTDYAKGADNKSFEYIDFGFVCLTRSTLSSIPMGVPTDLSVLFSELVGKRQLLAHEVFQRFHEIREFVKASGPESLLWSLAPGGS